jgi:putative restriction endonuclease
MFDRGLLSLADDCRILLSSHINDVDGARKLLNANGFASLPELAMERPDPRFLQWHRANCFKGTALA